MALKDDAFEWTTTKSGKLIIFRGGKQVTIVSAKKAVAVLARLGNSADEDQQILARATGQYRIGNERTPGSERIGEVGGAGDR